MKKLILFVFFAFFASMSNANNDDRWVRVGSSGDGDVTYVDSESEHGKDGYIWVREDYKKSSEVNGVFRDQYLIKMKVDCAKKEVMITDFLVLNKKKIVDQFSIDRMERSYKAVPPESRFEPALKYYCQ